MKNEYIKILCCPECKDDLILMDHVVEEERIKTGLLRCTNCSHDYEISNFIPRFVISEGYADSFGKQWNAFAKSQLDDGEINESSLRFDTEIGWKEKELRNKIIIEIGSGAGRFIDVVSKRGTSLAIGMDITNAVDASQANLGHRGNILFIQADIFKLPLKKEICDFVFSIGVLHHTPDPQKAFTNMVDLVKDDGDIGLSLYEISLYSRPNRNSIKVSTMDVLWSINLWRAEFFRIFTTRIPDQIMILYCKTIIPILHYLNKIPIIGLIRYLLPSTCYRKLPVMWSMVDTMDTYSTKIVHQYRAKDIFQWFLRLGLNNIILMNGRAGWVSLVANKGHADQRKSKQIVLESSPGIGNIGD